MNAFLVARVQRRGSGTGPPLNECENRGQNEQRGGRGGHQPADHRATQGCVLLAGFAESPAPSGSMPAIMATTGHEDRPQAAGRAVHGRIVGRQSFSAALSANVTSRIALAMATPIAMIAPMNDWMLSVVPVSQSISTTPAITRGHRGHRDQRQPQRLKIRGQAAKTPRPRPGPGRSASPDCISRIGGIWPRVSTCTPAGGAPARWIA